MSLLNFTTSNNRKTSINTKYIVLVYPHPENWVGGGSLEKDENQHNTVISDISGSRTIVKGTYEAILGYIYDSR